ncbi:MAG: S8 family serine peptidase [Pseudomonadota bacterium]|uniref:S8 family serine peptidase n=1 Tax=Phenylobacterium sp. TaxID=1871053 RepID=UPI0025D3C222|nr:S8 family serine peptidase [Phenylobacterium sp.]MBT9471397.1 S8 family serine peptidase [Phenylobacterium sp.]
MPTWSKAEGRNALQAQPVPETDLVVAPLYTPSDGMFASEWHLKNTGQTGGLAGIDLNVTSVWEDYTGQGVSIGVYDDGLDYRHIDLDGNYDASKQLLVNGVVSDALPTGWGTSSTGGDVHGTAVAGIIAAENNGVGVVGVAYDADLTGVAVLRSSAPTDMLTAINAMDRFDVVNASWSYVGSFVANYSGGTAFWNSFAAGVSEAADLGRGGLGTIIVKAAGNGRAQGEETNYDNFTNDRHVIAVGGVDHKGMVTSSSTPGSSLLVVAPSSNGSVAITTTDLSGAAGQTSTDYRTDFAGTSAATPMVTGVTALMLEANPDLGWRDVQDILAYSARRVGGAVGAAPSGYEEYRWAFNHAEDWNGGGLHFSNDYGFGLVDALAAVRLAETWEPHGVSANEISLSRSASPNAAIPDRSTESVSFTLTLTDKVRIDHVELSVDITHPNRGDLKITLTSPDGTVSTLLDRPKNGSDTTDNLTFKLSSNAFWGETSGGNWVVTVSDGKKGGVGTVNSVTLTTFGDEVSGSDTYIYTNEYATVAGDAARSTLSDIDGGVDTLNAAAVSSSSVIDLRPGAASTIAGKPLTLAPGAVIENAHGGDGADTITGNAVANILDGHRGDDRLTGGAGDDRLNGGDGQDTAVYAGVRANYSWTLDASGAVIVVDNVTGEGSDHLVGVEVLQFADVQVVVATGAVVEPTPPPTTPPPTTPSQPTITGTDGADSLSGGADNEILLGLCGADTLNGGAGADRLEGGMGGDSYYVDNTGDAVVEAVGEGLDRVYSALSTYTLTDNVENLTLLGSGGSGVGNALNNQIVGNSGANQISGGDGADVVDAGAGNDTLQGEAGADALYGRGGADVIDGGDGNDTLVGSTGGDVLTGGAGADIFDFDTAADSTATAPDRILDFTQGADRVDLATIDAQAGSTTNEAFHLVGQAAFSGGLGEVRYQIYDLAGTADDRTIIQGDTNGDRIADFEIVLSGRLTSLQASDFIL